MIVHNFQVDCMLKRLHQSLFGQRYDKGDWDILLNGLVRARWAELLDPPAGTKCRSHARDLRGEGPLAAES